jgi:hypothetical protein
MNWEQLAFPSRASTKDTPGKRREKLNQPPLPVKWIERDETRSSRTQAISNEASLPVIGQPFVRLPTN